MNQILDRLSRENYSCFDLFSGVYMFGSALWSDTPGDLDILLIYEPAVLSLIQSAEAVVIDKLSNELGGLPIHLTTLSESELISTDFLSKIAYVKIKGK